MSFRSSQEVNYAAVFLNNRPKRWGKKKILFAILFILIALSKQFSAHFMICDRAANQNEVLEFISTLKNSTNFKHSRH